FTATTTSLSSSLRQRSTRYTIRAGRNLPDKEFRYLRTVIVTADIHGDFGSTPRPACAVLTSYHNLSALVTCHTLYVVLTTLQSAVFLLNSRLTPFTATILRWHPFFRSYGARLPSSLTRFHSRAWVYSTHPPVSVYGTGALVYAGDFLGRSIEESASAVASTSPCGTRTINALLLSISAYSGLNFSGAGILNL